MKLNNLILIGYRASGKTTYGQALSKKLGHKFLDLDHLLEANINKSIKTLVEESGMENFRALEKKTLADLVASNLENHVIATGGGVILDPNNIKNLKKLAGNNTKNGKIVWLKPPIEEVIKFLTQDTTRPRLLGNDVSLETEIRETWEARKDIYKEVCDILVEVNILTDIDSQVLKIKNKLGL